MLIDGEKYACDACIRGHRVSSCQHSDRKLSHINRKGRPVSQCPHCRGLRKARANHVKCECAAKPHTKADCKKKEPKKDSTGAADEAAKHKQCCCSHGSRCVCAGKRESSLAAVPETGPAPNKKPTLPALKTPLDPLKPDIAASPYRHKTWKDASRHSHPYPIPRSHTVPAFSGHQHRSTDSLSLPGTVADPSPSPLHNPAPSEPVPIRRTVSEHGSPMPFEDLGPQVPPVDMPYHFSTQTASPISIPFASQSAGSAYNSDIESTFESSNLNTNIDWSALDFCGPDAVTTSAFSQPASFTSYDFNFSHPGLSRSNSGELSETGDISPISGMPMTQGNQLQGYDLGSVNDITDESFPLGTPSSYLGEMQPPLIASSNGDFDLDFFGGFPSSGGFAISPPVQHTPTFPPSQTKEGYSLPQNIPMNPNHNFATAATTTQGSPDQSYMAQAPIPSTSNATEQTWLPTSYPLTASPVPMSTPNQDQYPPFSFGQWSH